LMIQCRLLKLFHIFCSKYTMVIDRYQNETWLAFSPVTA